MERITLIFRRLQNVKTTRKRGFVELFVSKRLIQGLAAAMLTLFTPIFLFETGGNSFALVVLFYIVASLGYVLILVPAMQLTNKIGFSRALAVAALASVGQYALMYYIDASNFWQLIVPLVLTIIVFRTFHWVPYHVDFTAFTSGGSRGRDVSLMFATIAFMGVIGPILAGFIIQNAGYDVLFLIGGVLMFAAAISYLFVPPSREKFTWSLHDVYTGLTSRQFRPVLYSEFASGAETIVNLIAWPVFLFVLLDGNILEVGILSTVIVGVTIIIQLMVGRHLDKARHNSVRTLKMGSSLYAIGWILKIFVLSATHIFFVGLYHNITRIFTKTPYDALFYDMSGEQGRYVDEFTVMKEMVHHSGRAAGLLAMLGLTFFFSIEWTFLIGAAASLLLNMIYLAARN